MIRRGGIPRPRALALGAVLALLTRRRRVRAARPGGAAVRAAALLPVLAGAPFAMESEGVPPDVTGSIRVRNPEEGGGSGDADETNDGSLEEGSENEDDEEDEGHEGRESGHGKEQDDDEGDEEGEEDREESQSCPADNKETPKPNRPSAYPDWSWDHVRGWCAVRRADKYSDTQIRELAKQDIVMLEKANGFRTYGSIEEGTRHAARRIKAINPRCKTLFYHNAMVHYTGYNFQYAAYKTFKDEWRMRNPKTGKLHKWNKTHASYDHSNLEFREWWIQRALDMCAHDEIDGVFIDAIVKAEVASLPVKNHAKRYRETANELRRRLPAGKILIGNALRVGRGKQNGLTHLDYLDGSYLEQWYTSKARKLMGTLTLMSEALQRDKIVMLKAEPTQLNKSVLNKLSSLGERYNYIGESRFINFTLAYFLLIVEPNAYYSYRTGVDADPKKKACFDNSKFEAITRRLGAPLSGYVKVKTDQFSREFERIVVHVNLKTRQGALWVKNEQGKIASPTTPAPDALRVTVEADWQHHTGSAVGTYFSFVVSEWSQAFGHVVSNGAFYRGIEQWRDGRLVWTGDVVVWPPTARTKQPHGRTEPRVPGQFRSGDQLAPRPPRRVTPTSADWVHWTGRPAGTYFAFGLHDWSQAFGVDVTEEGVVYMDVDLWRDGVKIWTGNVKVWSRGAKDTKGPRGRADPLIPGRFQNWDQLSPGSGHEENARSVCEL